MIPTCVFDTWVKCCPRQSRRHPLWGRVNAATGLPVNVDGAIKNSRGDRKGWTERYTDAVEHPSDGRFVAYIDQVGLDAVDGQGQPVVSASERGRLKSREQVIADGFTRDRPNHSELAMADGRA